MPYGIGRGQVIKKSILLQEVEKVVKFIAEQEADCDGNITNGSLKNVIDKLVNVVAKCQTFFIK